MRTAENTADDIGELGVTRGMTSSLANEKLGEPELAQPNYSVSGALVSGVVQRDIASITTPFVARACV